MANEFSEIVGDLEAAMKDIPKIVQTLQGITTTIESLATTVSALESAVGGVVGTISDVSTIIGDVQTIVTDVQGVVGIVEGVAKDNQVQLRGPNLQGWEQLGTSAAGDFFSLVDALANHLGQPPSSTNPQGTGLFNVLGTLGGLVQPGSGGFLNNLFNNLPKIF